MGEKVKPLTLTRDMGNGLSISIQPTPSEISDLYNQEWVDKCEGLRKIVGWLMELGVSPTGWSEEMQSETMRAIQMYSERKEAALDALLKQCATEVYKENGWIEGEGEL